VRDNRGSMCTGAHDVDGDKVNCGTRSGGLMPHDLAKVHQICEREACMTLRVTLTIGRRAEVSKQSR